MPTLYTPAAPWNGPYPQAVSDNYDNTWEAYGPNQLKKPTVTIQQAEDCCLYTTEVTEPLPNEESDPPTFFPAGKSDGDTYMVCHPGGFAMWLCADGVWALQWTKAIPQFVDKESGEPINTTLPFSLMNLANLPSQFTDGVSDVNDPLCRTEIVWDALCRAWGPAPFMKGCIQLGPTGSEEFNFAGDTAGSIVFDTGVATPLHNGSSLHQYDHLIEPCSGVFVNPDTKRPVQLRISTVGRSEIIVQDEAEIAFNVNQFLQIDRLLEVNGVLKRWKVDSIKVLANGKITRSYNDKYADCCVIVPPGGTLKIGSRERIAWGLRNNALNDLCAIRVDQPRFTFDYASC